MTGTPPDILALTCRQFAGEAAANGIAQDRARAIYRSVFRDGRSADGHFRAEVSPVRTQFHESGTTKFTQQVDGPLESESVILPQRSTSGQSRTTLCVSSQIGCAMGCTFCETAQMGLLRNLTAAQIVGQWYAARFELGHSISNVVFMGMGEPLDNLDEVVQSIRVLTDHNGAAIPASRITVSTVGRVRGIERLQEFARTDGFRQVRLAVSLNAPNDAIRSKIMPVNRAEPIDTLLSALHQWCESLQQRVLIEYVLIPGVNDSRSCADAVASLLAPLPCTINVIPYNPRRDSPWPAPDDQDVEAFINWLRSAGRFVKRRRTMGRSVMAACGQLGNEHIRRRRTVTIDAGRG